MYSKKNNSSFYDKPSFERPREVICIFQNLTLDTQRVSVSLTGSDHLGRFQTIKTISVPENSTIEFTSRELDSCYDNCDLWISQIDFQLQSNSELFVFNPELGFYGQKFTISEQGIACIQESENTESTHGVRSCLLL